MRAKKSEDEAAGDRRRCRVSLSNLKDTRAGAWRVSVRSVPYRRIPSTFFNARP